jgi:hypothetical protein
LFQDDDGVLDLSKVQLIGWTGVSVAAFFVALADQIVNYGRPHLPDIDASLMALMGFGHVAYLGKKVVSSDTPVLSGVSPPGVPAPNTSSLQVSVFGKSLGDTEVGNQVLFDGWPSGAAVAPGDWTDTKVQFTLPRLNVKGEPWNASDKIEIGLLVSGRQTENTMPFTITPAWADALFPASIVNVTPASATPSQGTRITIAGEGFGSLAGPIYVDADPLSNVVVHLWEDDQIILSLPPQWNGRSWQANQTLSLGIKVGDRVVRFRSPFTIVAP